MTDERLEARIRDQHLGIGRGDIEVHIDADKSREDDFDAVREAVKGVLSDE